MARVIFAICILIYSNGFSQDFINKDFKSAKHDIRKLFVSKGFHFLKETNQKEFKSQDIRYQVDLLYKEEFTVTLTENNFENLSSYQIYTDRKDVIDKIKKVFNFSGWIYIDSKSDGTKEYKFENLLISFSERPQDSRMKYSIFIRH